MAKRTLTNPRTGETITFLETSQETAGEVFAMAYSMRSGARIADEHCHPFQEMTIRVNAGVLTATMSGEDRQIAAGESCVIPAGVFHFQRNDGDEPVEAVEEYRPARHMQEFFEVLIGWANDGRTDEHGLPTPLRSAVMHHHFRDSIRSASARRNLLAALLAPIGALMGYRRELQGYIAEGRREQGSR